METFLIWLATWLSLTALLIGGLLVANLLSEFKRLRRSSVPHPAFVIRRRVIGAVLPHQHRGAVTVPGQTAWLSWDLRWVAAGETLASVERVLPESGELKVHLRQPIVLAADTVGPAVRMETVTFVPRRPGKVCYTHGSVRGKLLPSIPGDLTATAEIVVYPDGFATDA
jgi:hypothetical protein